MTSQRITKAQVLKQLADGLYLSEKAAHRSIQWSKVQPGEKEECHVATTLHFSNKLAPSTLEFQPKTPVKVKTTKRAALVAKKPLEETATGIDKLLYHIVSALKHRQVADIHGLLRGALSEYATENLTYEELIALLVE